NESAFAIYSESMTVTLVFDISAALLADSTVPLSLPAKWMDKISLSSSPNSSYNFKNSPTAGCEVFGNCVDWFIFSINCDGVISTRSKYVSPSIDIDNGITCIFKDLISSGERSQVESVTIFIFLTSTHPLMFHSYYTGFSWTWI